jgi:hypothetical protein
MSGVAGAASSSRLHHATNVVIENVDVIEAHGGDHGHDHVYVTNPSS